MNKKLREAELEPVSKASTAVLKFSPTFQDCDIGSFT